MRFLQRSALHPPAIICCHQTVLRLADLNRPFFDACDNLFVNYTWRQDTPAAVQTAAGPRARDVFLGVDCFGRGTFGGGRMDTCIGLSAAAAAGLSAALFAQAWPFECEDEWQGCAGWKHRNAVFWQRISTAWPCRPPTLLVLPFHTDFCIGSGHGLIHRGQPLHDLAWINLSRTTPLPLLEWHAPATTSLRAGLTSKAAFSGCSSIRVHGSLVSSHRLRLFGAAVALPPDGMRISFVAAVSCSTVLPRLSMLVQDKAGYSDIRIFCSPGLAYQQDKDSNLLLPATERALAPLIVVGNGNKGSNSSKGLQWIEYASTFSPADYARILQASQFPVGSELWLTAVDLEVHVPTAGAAKTGTAVATDTETSVTEKAVASFELWLGALTLTPLSYDCQPGSVLELAACEKVLRPGLMPGCEPGATELSLLLRWRKPESGAEPVRYHVWVQEEGNSDSGSRNWQWVGMAHVSAAGGYRVSSWRVQATAHCTLRFAVQSVGPTGLAQPLEDASTIDVALTLEGMGGV